MKKILFTLIAVLAFCVNAMADGVCATLQHGDEMKAYYGADAFKSAYADAVNGDVITLSKGQFNVVSSVAKSVKIIGTYGFTDDATVSTLVASMGVDADSVYVEGIYFSGDVTLGNIKDCIIRRCFMNQALNAKESCTNTNSIIDQCVVRNDYAIGSSVNYTIKNSTINSFKASSNKAYILNNVVYEWASYSTPYAIYKNNLLGISDSKCKSESHPLTKTVISNYSVPNIGAFYNNCFFVDFYTDSGYTFTLYPTFSASCTNSGNVGSGMYQILGLTDYSKREYPAPSRSSYGTGQDGTSKGPYGGSGFSKNPAIPLIIYSKIDARTDADGKLNVEIMVKTSDDKKATGVKWYKYWWNDNIDMAVKEDVENVPFRYVFSQQLTVPDYARTGFNGQPLIARLNFVFGDDAGNVSPMTYTDVIFPDINPPASHIEADKKAAYTSVNISWGGEDEELKDFNVYVSENDLPYVLWLPNTTATKAEFKGEPGKTYRFTVTARDKSDNVEKFNCEKCATVKFNKR